MHALKARVVNSGFVIETPAPLKAPCRQVLQAVAEGEVEGVIDTEILQEILVRYRAIRRPAMGREAVRPAMALVDTVLAIRKMEIERAIALMEADPRVEVRGAIHAAAALLAGVTDISSVDRAFDRLPGLRRVDPPAVSGRPRYARRSSGVTRVGIRRTSRRFGHRSTRGSGRSGGSIGRQTSWAGPLPGVRGSVPR